MKIGGVVPPHIHSMPDLYGVSTIRGQLSVADLFLIGATPDRRMIGGLFGPSGSLANAAVGAADALYALPLYTVREGTIDRVGFKVGVAGPAGSKSRCGIYGTDATGVYPGALIVDGGEKTSDVAAVYETNVNVAKTAGQLLWLAFICNNAPGVPTLLCLLANTCFPLGGTSNLYSGTLTGGYRKDAAGYGALPANFPAAATLQGTSATLPAIGVRFAT